jgi:hypothetical protein
LLYVAAAIRMSTVCFVRTVFSAEYVCVCVCVCIYKTNQIVVKRKEVGKVKRCKRKLNIRTVLHVQVLMMLKRLVPAGVRRADFYKRLKCFQRRNVAQSAVRLSPRIIVENSSGLCEFISRPWRWRSRWNVVCFSVCHMQFLREMS